MFYYLLHVPLIHLVALIFAYAKYGHAEWLFMNWPPPGQPPLEPPDYGYNLWVVYAVWLGVVVALYPLCRWFLPSSFISTASSYFFGLGSGPTRLFSSSKMRRAVAAAAWARP
jgi:hypothetical protein